MRQILILRRLLNILMGILSLRYIKARYGDVFQEDGGAEHSVFWFHSRPRPRRLRPRLMILCSRRPLQEKSYPSHKSFARSRSPSSLDNGSSIYHSFGRQSTISTGAIDFLIIAVVRSS